MDPVEVVPTAQIRVQTALEELVHSGHERGVQVAAYLDGRLVVDAWAGIADPASRRPVDGDTLFHCWSTGKGITVTALHLLADRGLIKYDAPIARYWPEWAANGKGRATVRHALVHSAGVPQMPAGVTIGDLGDWDAMCDRIAAEPPIWCPGTRVAYHGYTFGYIVGEIIRRATGEDIASVVRDEIARPLDIEDDLFLALPQAQEHRIAAAEDGGLQRMEDQLPDDALFRRIAPSPLLPSAELTNEPRFRQATIPSSGIMSARAIARMYAALSVGGGLDGARLISRQRLDIATAPQTRAVDEAFGMRVLRGLGYFLGGPLGLPPMGGRSPLGNRATVFGHNGTGGSVAFADPSHGFAFALTKNRLSADPPELDSAVRIAALTRDALGIPS
jgi:CubicO group peptidase (beta-lactamase class C family)